MIPIRTYVDVQITRATQGVSRQGFGTPLILGEVSEFYDRTKSYTGISSLGEDFSTTSDIYLKGLAIFSQNPRPRTIKVGRKYADVNALQKITFDNAATAGTFTITVGSQTTSTIAYNSTTTAIKSALEALSNISSVTVTQLVASKEWTIEFTGTDGNKHWDTIVANVSGLTTTTSSTETVIQYGSADEDYTDALDAVCTFDDDFYALCIISKLDADITAIAANIQARSKIFTALTNDADVITSSTSDIASILYTAGYSRTNIIYTDATDGNQDAAWLGRMLPYVAGRATWAFKELEGEDITAYSSSERSYAIGKKANIYHLVSGKRITDNGTMTNGEFIDNMICIDFLIARIGEDVFQVLTDADKIPYTDAGVGIIKGILEARLSSASRQGILDTYSVEVPKVADISTTERANRVLPDVEFQGRLQGAIHEILINGKVSV